MEVKPGSCVYVMDNAISDELCDTIKIVIDNTYGYMEEFGRDSNVQAKSVRTSLIENKKFGAIIDKEIYKVVNNIIKRIIEVNPDIADIGSDSGYQLRKIHGSTRGHVDSIFPDKIPDNEKSPSIYVRSVRKASLIIALNSDYEGGEFYFPTQGIDKIKLKKGQAILFPPYWTHPHGVSKPENNTFRYTINTWLTE
jgi:hypothetical protein